MEQLLQQIFNCKQQIVRLILPLAAFILATSLWATPASATGVYQMPSLAAGDPTWVVDEAEILSRLNEGKISSELETLAKQTGNEVRIVTVRRLDYGETPASFTQALFKKWFPTPEVGENQTLLMIDSVTNGTAIVTGDKVKSIMPDDIAESVANETVMAPLRDGDKYNQAFLDATDRLVAVLSGQPDPGAPQLIDKVQVEGTFTKAEDTEKNKGNATAWVIGLLIAATIIPMATYYLYLVNQPSSNG
jgi:uncharacterized protein